MQNACNGKLSKSAWYTRSRYRRASSLATAMSSIVTTTNSMLPSFDRGMTAVFVKLEQ